MKKFLPLLFVILALSLLAVQCGAAPTPEVIEKEVVVEKEVVKTVVVEKEVPVEKKVVETVVVEKEVVKEVPAKLPRVGLVTDVGRVNDGTFNQYAYEGMLRVADELGLESTFIETQQQTDYEKNVNTLIQDGYQVIVTVGFLFTDASLKLAKENPDVMIIGVDQFYAEPQPNLVGILFREDQGGFLAGVLCGMMTKSDVVGIVAGMEIPPVVKFRRGFEHGAHYVNPDVQTPGVYIDSFTDPARGKEAALSMMAEGADCIFGAGGPTGSGGILGASQEGAWVIGVDQDEYYTTFGGGTVAGVDKLISSAVKRVDVGVYDMIKAAVLKGKFPGAHYILEAANNGISYAPFHDAEGAVPKAVANRLEEIRKALADGSLTTGVGPDGSVVEAEIPAPVPFVMGVDEISQIEFTKPIELVFWHTKSRSQKDLLELIIDEFNKANPYGITVIPEQIESYDTVFKKTMAAIAAGNPPDLMVAYPSMVAEYQAADVPLVLDPYIRSQKYGLSPTELADFFAAYLEDNTYPVFGNQMLSFPFHKSMVTMFVNMTLLEMAGVDKVPETWDEFYQTCKKVVENTQATNCWAIHIEASDVDAFMATVGVYPQADSETLTSRLNDPKVVEFFELVQKMVNEGLARPEAERYSGDDEMVALDAAFTTGSTSGLPYFPRQEDGTYAIDWIVAPLPHNPDVAPVSMLYGANIAATRSGDPQRDLAKWLFIKYWTSPEVVDKWINGTDEIRGSGYMPIRQSVLERPRTQAHLAKDPHYAQAVSQLPLGKIEPQLAGQQAVRDILEDVYLRIINGEDVKTVLDEAKAQADEQFQLKGY